MLAITGPVRFLTLLLCAALAPAMLPARAQEPSRASGVQPLAMVPSPAYLAAQTRWKSSLDAFAQADRDRLPQAGGVLFVGSSSIRLWNDLAQDFRRWPVVINRGFGGSTMAECSLFVRELVTRYRPRHVLVYAGDNDLAEGRTPLEVLDAFARFLTSVREDLPDTRISYISIKPSPLRAALLVRAREVNHMIEAYTRTQANTEFIDIYTPMMAADGRPRPELFLADRLHMNEAGYRLWHQVIASHMEAFERGAAPVVAAPALPMHTLPVAPVPAPAGASAPSHATAQR